MKKSNKLQFRIVEDEEMIYLECNGGMDIGYMKQAMNISVDEAKEEFKKRVKLYNGILID